jgi:hypothetical protein
VNNQINVISKVTLLLISLFASTSAIADDYSNQVELDAALSMLDDPPTPMHSPGPSTCNSTPTPVSTPTSTPKPNTPIPVKSPTPNYIKLSESNNQDKETMRASPNLNLLGQLSWYKKHDHFEADLDVGLELQSNVMVKVPVTIPNIPGLPGAGTTQIVDASCGSREANLAPGVKAHKGPFCTCGNTSDNGVPVTDPAAYCAAKMTIMNTLGAEFIRNQASWAKDCYKLNPPKCTLTITRQCGACPDGLKP